MNIVIFSFLLILKFNVGNIQQKIASNAQQKMLIEPVFVTKEKVSKVQETVVDSPKGLQKVGEIAVPKLGILMPIYNQPYNKKALEKGSQQMSTISGQTSTLGVNNFIVVGHNYADGHSAFSALQENLNQDQPYLQKGQKSSDDWLNGQQIYVANKNNIYDFQIDRQYLIDESDQRVLQDSKQAEINLITCLEPSDQYRIVTHGVLKQKWNWEQAPLNIIDYFNLQKFQYNVKG